MSILKDISNPIKEINNLLDNLFTSKEEVLSKEIIMMRLQQHLDEKRLDINKILASHSSIFVAGWISAIGWTCAVGFFYHYVVRIILETFGINTLPIDIESLHTLVGALLVTGTLKTYERIKGVK